MVPMCPSFSFNQIQARTAGGNARVGGGEQQSRLGLSRVLKEMIPRVWNLICL
jgi:hypothetical protein